MFKMQRQAALAAALCLVMTHYGYSEPGQKNITPTTSGVGSSVTYIGHATVLLRLAGTALLTDPLFSEQVGPIARQAPLGMALNDLPPLDAVLISHNHWDHLDKRSLKSLDKTVPLIVPDGLQKKVRKLGFQDVRGLKTWETTKVRNAEITAVPARHWGTHCGYLIHAEGKTVYFAGDTGLFDGMRAIGERGPIDLALLPIGAYRPRLSFIPGTSWAMRRVHMAPEDLPEAAAMLKAKIIVPIHWGTFKLTGEPVKEPMERLQRLLDAQDSLKAKVRVVKHGETMNF